MIAEILTLLPIRRQVFRYDPAVRMRLTVPVVLAASLVLIVMGVPLRAEQDVFVPPVRLVEVKPVYTPEAIRARLQGDVTVGFEILTDGTVGKTDILGSLDSVFGLDQKALEAVRQWKFKPATRNGVPVVARVTAVVRFVLRNDGPPLAAPTPPSAWPDLFAATGTSDTSGSQWTPGSVAIGDKQLHFDSPAGWMTMSGERGSLLLSLNSPDLRRMVMVGSSAAPAVQSPLPLQAGRLQQFAETMLKGGASRTVKIGRSGQVQIGDRWWLWVELPSDASVVERMPPMLRDLFATNPITDLAGWAFVTFEGGQMIEVLCTSGASSGSPDRDAERLGAAAVFRAVLTRMSLSK